MKGNIVPWWDFTPKWLGLKSLGLSPNTIFVENTVREEFLKRFWNSTIIAFSSSTIAVALGSCSAYGLSRFSYRFGFMRNSDISFFFLSQLILPPVVLALPFLVLYKELALLDTRIGLIALYTLTVLPIVIWIMRDQFGSIPVELEEAAKMDGAGFIRIFVTIMLPLTKPVVATVSILQVLHAWNDFLLPLVITLANPGIRTLSVGVYAFKGEYFVDWSGMAAASVITILPIIILFLFMQKYFVEGVQGAVKG